MKFQTFREFMHNWELICLVDWILCLVFLCCDSSFMECSLIEYKPVLGRQFYIRFSFCILLWFCYDFIVLWWSKNSRIGTIIFLYPPTEFAFIFRAIRHDFFFFHQFIMFLNLLCFPDHDAALPFLKSPNSGVPAICAWNTSYTRL